MVLAHIVMAVTWYYIVKAVTWYYIVMAVIFRIFQWVAVLLQRDKLLFAGRR